MRGLDRRARGSRSSSASGPQQPSPHEVPHHARFFFRYRAESAMPMRALIVMSFVSSATPGVPGARAA